MNMLHAYRARRSSVNAPADRSSGATLLPPALAREMSLILAVIVLLDVIRPSPPLVGVRATIGWVAALAFVITFVVVVGRSLTGRPLIALVLLWGGCAIALQSLPVGIPALIITLIAIMQASRIAAPLGPILAALTGIGYEAASAASGKGFGLGDLLSSGSGLLFAYLAVANVRRLRLEKEKTDVLLAEVLAGRDAQVRAAALDERARIAREIHDILAHTLSALAVHLEGTRLLIEQRPGDPAAVAALERANGLARDGLEETQRAVGALRGDTLPGPDELPGLVAAFERDTGIASHLCVDGPPVPLAPEARLAIYRTVQEALTNIRKHSASASVAVGLRYGERQVELTVENEGEIRPSPLPGGGNGLNGMRERAALAHGHLEAGPTATGFRVALWLPL